jgi:predicted kinase
VIPELSEKRFVIVSGLPESGKSRLASQLAPLLGLAIIDKDAILERLFESRGAGGPEWRRALSRESDLIFRREAESSSGAILVTDWHVPGMPSDSGTATNWLLGLSTRIINLHCECPFEIAAARFSRRNRHAGHLDNTRSHDQILASIRDFHRRRQLLCERWRNLPPKRYRHAEQLHSVRQFRWPERRSQRLLGQ